LPFYRPKKATTKKTGFRNFRLQLLTFSNENAVISDFLTFFVIIP